MAKTNVGDITVVLELDDKAYTVKLRNADRLISQFSRTLNSTDRSVRNIEASVTGLLSKMRDVFVTLSMVRGALHTTGQALFGWQMAIVDANAELERITTLMYGMSKASDQAARSLEAAANVDFAIDLAMEMPFQLSALTDAMVKFRSVGLDPTNGSLKSLTNAVAAFGGNSDILHRASIAIQQMAGKGVVSMEELRQQLGEAVPEAITLMARSVGMSYQELVDHISRGEVAAEEALARMLNEFQYKFDGAGKRMMQTWNGLTQQLATKWMLFKKDIGDTGYFDAVKAELENLVDLMGDDRVKLFAQEFGAALAEGVRHVRNGIILLVEWREEIGHVISLAAKAVILLKVANWIATLNSKLGLLAGAAAAGKAALVAAGVSASIFRGHVVGATAATLALRNAVNALGVAFKANPLGWLLSGVGLTIAAVSELKSHLGEVEEIVERFDKAKGLGATREELDKVTQAMKEMEDEVEKAKTHLMSPDRFKLNNYMRNKEARETIAQYQRMYETREEMAKAVIKREVEEYKQAQQEMLDAAMEASNTQYELRAVALYEQLQNGEVAQDEYFRQREEAMRERIEAQREIVKKALEDAANKHDAAIKAGDEEAIQKYIAIISEYAKRLNELNEELEQYRSKNGATRLLTKEDEASLKRADSLLENLRSRIAQVKEQDQQPGSKGYVERLRSLIDSGMYGTNADKLAEILALANELENTIAQRTFNDKMRDMAVATGEAADELDRLLGIASRPNEFEQMLARGDFGDVTRLTQAQQDAARASFLDNEFLAENIDLTKEALDANKKYAEWRRTQASEAIEDMQESSQALEEGLLSEQEAIKARYDFEVQQRRDALDNAHATDEQKRQLEEGFARWYLARTEQLARDLETPLERMFREWEDNTNRIKEASVGWMEQFSDTLSNALIDGEADWKRFADSVIRELMRIQVQKMIAGIAGSWGSSSSSSMISDQTGYTGGIEGVLSGDEFDNFANGGIMTQWGKLPLKSYSSGGIADDPQLAVYGEGRRPEAYVPLPDGKTIPVTMQGGGDVQINIINQGNEELKAEQGQQRFDGKQMVLDVVLTAVQRPGPFRDGMKGALK